MLCLKLIKLQEKHKVLYLLFYLFFATLTEEITRSSDQVKIRLVSQWINGISRVLQKLLKYFKGTGVSTYFVLPGAGVFPVIWILYLIKWIRLCYIIIWIISITLPQRYFQTIIAIFNKIIHWHYNIDIFCIIYLSIIYLTYAVSEWGTVFKHCSFISFI